MEATLGALIGVAAGFMLQQWWETYKSDRAVLRDIQALLIQVDRAERERGVQAVLMQRVRDGVESEDGSMPLFMAEAGYSQEKHSKLTMEVENGCQEIVHRAWRIQGSRYTRIAASAVLAVQTRYFPGKLLRAIDPVLKELSETLNPELLEELERQQRK